MSGNQQLVHIADQAMRTAWDQANTGLRYILDFSTIIEAVQGRVYDGLSPRETACRMELLLGRRSPESWKKRAERKAPDSIT